MAHPRTFRGLQAVRLAAALLVLVTHAGFYASERLSPGFRYWNRGATGVELFFVLSGFVMVYSSNHLTRDPEGPRIFAERRLVRIVPLYWLATTLKLATMLLTTGLVLHAQFSPWKTLCSYLFLPTRNVDGELRPLLAVGWTLNFEMLFYALFAFALLLRRRVDWTVGTVLVALTIGSYFRGPSWPAASFYLDPVVLDFFWGMLIARAYLQGVRLPAWMGYAGLVVGALLLLVLPVTQWKIPVLGVAAAVIVWAVITLEPVFARIPRPVLFLGDASYAIYLFHPLVAPLAPTLLLRLHLHSASFSVLCSILLALAVGGLLHRFLELPLTEWLKDRIRIRGRRFIHPPDSAGLEATAAEQLPLRRTA